MLEGTQWPQLQYYPNDTTNWYPPSNTLTYTCDDQTTRIGSKDDVTWWAAADRATGSRAYFVMDLGCQKCVDKVTVANSAHGSFNDRCV